MPARSKKKEAVNHPQHYGGADNPYEVIKVLRAWLTPEEYIGALKFNVIKYEARARDKNELEDYEKAKWYQDELVRFMKERADSGAETLDFTFDSFITRHRMTSMDRFDGFEVVVLRTWDKDKLPKGLRDGSRVRAKVTLKIID